MSERYLDGDGGEEEVEGVGAHTRHALGAARALQQRQELRDRACPIPVLVFLHIYNLYSYCMYINIYIYQHTYAYAYIHMFITQFFLHVTYIRKHLRGERRHALGAARALQQREELRDRACRVI